MRNPEKGRRILEGLLAEGRMKPDKMVEALAVLDYWKHEQEIVDRRGECSSGCEHTDLVEQEFTGQMVCPRTGQACPKRALNELIEVYGAV